MIDTGETGAALTALQAAGMVKIVLMTMVLGAIAAGATLLFRPVEIAIYVFAMASLAPAAIAFWALSASDREINRRAPELFYDMSEYVRASGSLHKALRRASAGQYGIMSDEIRRVLSEIEDEGYDLATALKAMAGRAKNAYITRSVSVINEALTSSPDAESVLKMVAAEGRMSQALEAERKAGTSSAILVMYLTVFIFLLVVSLCLCSFVPVSGRLQDLSVDGAAIPESPVAVAMPYYVLSMSVATCAGLTIGAMRDNSVFGGLKDAAALATAAFLVYELIVFPGFDVMGALGL